LDVQAWEQFFRSRGINTDTPALATLHNAYGGNAKAMDIISGAALEDFSSNIEAYWQANQDDLFIERDLEDLVTKQFDRYRTKIQMLINCFAEWAVIAIKIYQQCPLKGYFACCGMYQKIAIEE
jgi:hypothetical protein